MGDPLLRLSEVLSCLPLNIIKHLISLSEKKSDGCFGFSMFPVIDPASSSMWLYVAEIVHPDMCLSTVCCHKH